MSKSCSGCKLEKSIDCFNSYKRQADGRDYYCKDCRKLERVKRKDKLAEYGKAYREANAEKCKELWKNWAEANKEHLKEKDRQYLINNRDKVRAKNRRLSKKRFAEKYGTDEKFTEQVKANVKKSYHKHIEKRTAYNKKYKAENREYFRNAETLRRASIRHSDYCKQQLENCKEVYIEAEKLKKEVDHIIPLKHKDVCGLHVPENLQLLSVEENSYKRNRFDGTYSNESWREKYDKKN